jgi:hypothetical protein
LAPSARLPTRQVLSRSSTTQAKPGWEDVHKVDAYVAHPNHIKQLPDHVAVVKLDQPGSSRMHTVIRFWTASAEAGQIPPHPPGRMAPSPTHITESVSDDGAPRTRRSWRQKLTQQRAGTLATPILGYLPCRTCGHERVLHGPWAPLMIGSTAAVTTVSAPARASRSPYSLTFDPGAKKARRDLEIITPLFLTRLAWMEIEFLR